ncbi:MAG: trypsin-like peptidase domain-containing protein [Myxococcota bacterium]
MLRHVLALGLASILGGLVPSTADAASRTDYKLGHFYSLDEVDDAVVERAAAAVVRFPTATGFIIHPDGYVLTNHHVRTSFGRRGTVKRRWVEGGAAESLDVQLVFDDADRDIALYRVIDPPGSLPAVEITTRAATPGEPVFVLGHPKGHRMRASFGRVLVDEVEIGGRPSVEYSAQTWWGSSGSPVFDAQGRAIAIHWGWDSKGLSNGRLTGVPFDVIEREVERMRPYLSNEALGGAPPDDRGCDDPSQWSLRTRLVARGERTDRLKVTVVAPDPSCEDVIDSVGYQLHPTFENPTPSVRGTAPLRLRAWGSFVATAVITRSDGETLTFADRIAW